jgi:Beta-propeller repeat
MRAFLRVTLSTLLSLTLLRGAQAASVPPPDPEPTTPATQQHVQKLLTGLPLSFIPNHGQADKQIKYSLHGRDTQVYFTTKGLTMVLTEPGKKEEPHREASLKAMAQTPEARPRWVTKLDFVNARRDLQLEGVERGEAVVSYFKGKEDQWKTGLPTYQKVIYRDVWPGIDVEYSGTGQKLKTTYMVKPGADPKQIRLAYRGVTKLALAENGQLNVHTPKQVLTEDTPYSYQEINGKRQEVRSAYRLRRHGSQSTRGFEYGFEVGKYDRSQTLIIDPVLVVYAGYIGGNRWDYSRGIAVDSAGNAYVTGSTSSNQTTFPVKVGPDLTHNGSDYSYDAFVAKVRADGTGLVYAGYIGGNETESGIGIAVDSAGNAYVTGWTNCTQATFPVKVGPDLSYNGGDSDAFVAKVKADGTGLVYAGYIGGSRDDYANDIAVDSTGATYVTGQTTSTQATFPVKVGPDLSYNGGLDDAFVAKVKADGAGLVYAGYIGGSGNNVSGGNGSDTGNGIAVDSVGNAYVTGKTRSDEMTFPVKVGPDLTQNSRFYVDYDAFVAKVKADGTDLVYAGYIGGVNYDDGEGIAVDSAGNVYVTGSTGSDQTTFPVTVGPDLSHNGSYWDVFVTKVKADGTGLVYAGYIGGSGDDYGNDVAVDSVGNAYVTGSTSNST